MAEWAKKIVEHSSKTMLIAILRESVEKVDLYTIIREAEDQDFLQGVHAGFSFLFGKEAPE